MEVEAKLDVWTSLGTLFETSSLSAKILELSIDLLHSLSVHVDFFGLLYECLSSFVDSNAAK